MAAAVRTPQGCLGIPVHRRFGLSDGRLVMPIVSLQMEAKRCTESFIHASLQLRSFPQVPLLSLFSSSSSLLLLPIAWPKMM